LNPLASDPSYTPVKNTTMGWGAWPVYGANFPLEYYYFSSWFGVVGGPLPSASVNRLMTNLIDYYGLLNLYNSIRYMSAYFQ
jgi:hypothetical protein